MDYLNYILYTLNLTAAVYLVMPAIIYVISVFRNRKSPEMNEKVQKDIGVVITAHKEFNLIQPLIESLNAQDYRNYHIYLVADGAGARGPEVSGDKLTVLVPRELLNSKVRSIEYAHRNFIRNHDAICIMDSDNLAHPDFLKEMNRFLANSYKAVQGNRTYKNTNTGIALIDALRDLYYNYYDQQIPFKAGFSSGITGSAMAFETELLMKTIRKFDAHGGFDKMLQYEVVDAGFTIGYSGKAIVYDEKTDSQDMLLNQRTRWIHSWFSYYFLSLKLFVRGTVTLNPGRIYFGLQAGKPPLFLLMLAASVILLADLLAGISPAVLLSAYTVFILAFTLPVVKQGKLSFLVNSLFTLPGFFFTQISAMLQMKKASQKFIHTKHTNKVTIDEILQKTR